MLTLVRVCNNATTQQRNNVTTAPGRGLFDTGAGWFLVDFNSPVVSPFLGDGGCGGMGMQSKAKTVAAYLKELPAERRAALQQVREVFLENLPAGYEEGMQYGMIGYYVPHGVYPAGYHCDPQQPVPFAGMASQKNHMSLYLMCVYGDPEQRQWFEQAWKASGKKLDMGKACVRFKRVEDLPLEVIGEAVRRVPVKKFLKYYETTLAGSKRGKSAAKKQAAKKSTAKKSVKKTKMASAKQRTTMKKATVAQKAAKKAVRKATAKQASPKRKATARP
jgi:hypothetical protein